MIRFGSSLRALGGQFLQNFVRCLADRFAEPVIVGKAQHAVAARRLRGAQARQRHLQERQGVAALGVGDENRSERAALASFEPERRIADGGGTGRHLFELARRSGRQIERRAGGAQRDEIVDALEKRIGVAAQRHQHRRDAAPTQRSDQPGKPLLRLGRRLDQQTFGLVDGEEQARRARGLKPRLASPRLGRRVERGAERRDRDVGVAGELLSQHLARMKGRRLELRAERFVAEQAFGQRLEGIEAGNDDRAAPKVHFGENAGQTDARHQAGADERGFAGSAGADHQQERRPLAVARRRLDLAQTAQRLVDDERAAEEDGLPAFVERREAGVGRSQPRRRSHFATAGGNPRRVSHCRRQSSTLAANSSVARNS